MTKTHPKNFPNGPGKGHQVICRPRQRLQPEEERAVIVTEPASQLPGGLGKTGKGGPQLPLS